MFYYVIHLLLTTCTVLNRYTLQMNWETIPERYSHLVQMTNGTLDGNNCAKVFMSQAPNLDRKYS